MIPRPMFTIKPDGPPPDHLEIINLWMEDGVPLSQQLKWMEELWGVTVEDQVRAVIQGQGVMRP